MRTSHEVRSISSYNSHPTRDRAWLRRVIELACARREIAKTRPLGSWDFSLHSIMYAKSYVTYKTDARMAYRFAYFGATLKFSG